MTDNAKVYIETLYHYQCDDCKFYWTIADKKVDKGDSITCPHCAKSLTVNELIIPTVEANG